jgi:hypothetical protein
MISRRFDGCASGPAQHNPKQARERKPPIRLPATWKGGQNATDGTVKKPEFLRVLTNEAERVLDKVVEPTGPPDERRVEGICAVGQNFAAHETVQHARREYVRGPVHANSVEGFNLRVQRTVAGVFHHISSEHADLYFHEIGFRWSQHIAEGEVSRRTPARPVGKSPEPCGHGCRRRSSCRRSSAPLSGERCASPASAVSPSNPLSLPLLDKSGVV